MRILTIIILALGISPSFASTAQAGLTPKEISSLVQSVPVWSSVSNYSKGDWSKLIAVAVQLQAVNPATLAEGFSLFEIQNTNDFRIDYLEGSKPFILLRVMFEIPERFAGHPRGSGWLAEGSDVNSDGTVNAGWPLSWNKGNPRFVSKYRGYEGFSYHPKDDYLYLSKTFTLRNLDPSKNQSTFQQRR